MGTEAVPKKITTVNKLINKINDIRRTHHEVSDEMVLTTIKRLYYSTLVFVPMLLIQLYLFWRTPVSTPLESRWRLGIMISYGLLLLYIIPVFFITGRLKQQQRVTRVSQLVINASLVVLLTAGVTLVVVDQWVTSSITPFLIVCTLAALLFLVHPLQSILCYVGTFLLYYWAMGLVQTDPAVLLSNRVNGVTSVSIGIILTIILWTKTAETIRQEQFIVLQQNELGKKNQELEAKNKDLEYYASYDTLTNLYNRRQLQLLAEQELRHAKRNKHPVSLLIADIDRFKTINDQFGHPVGDKLLIHLADLIRTRLRESDVAARWGGEEFLILLPKAGLDEAAQIGEELRKMVETECFQFPPNLICYTISIGISTFDTSLQEPFMEAYREADQALYLAKEQGRNRIQTVRNPS